ncbi:MAG TPA: ATP-binding protein [Methylomirabilota bacterium]|nr:ATP-binding protein [Methylomirabilota bacterium]
MPRSLRPLLTAIRTLGRLGAPASADRAARPTDESLLAALTAGRTVAWEWDLRTDRVVRTQNAPGLLGLPVTNAADHGQTFERLIHPDDRERVRQSIQSALAAGTPMASQFRIVRDDGSIVWVLDDGQFEVDRAGRPLRMRGILRDITEQKLLEARLERAHQEAEAANQAKDQFLATLSHELRTPLNAVLGWARMLASGQLDPAATRRAVEVIERNAEAQAQLVDDLLDLARITTGKLRLDLRPVDVALVIERAVDVVRPTASAKGIRLQVALDQRAGPIMGDADRLQQVVWNLLSNAVKFTPRGGRVQVFLARVNSHIEVQVSDSGSGIARALLPHLFERFRQGADGAARPQGLGLGLALVKHLVEQHGGTVTADSPGEGQGAVFTVALPIMIHAAPAGSGDHPTAPRFRGLSTDLSLAGVRVLAVDDDPDATELMTHVLRGRGAEVRTARSAREGFALLETWRPDVLICDIEMPEENGYDFIARVRVLPDPRAAVPAIAVTAYARTEDRVRAIGAGFTSHIPKPVEPVELVTVVGALARRAR